LSKGGQLLAVRGHPPAGHPLRPDQRERVWERRWQRLDAPARLRSSVGECHEAARRHRPMPGAGRVRHCGECAAQ